MHSCGLTAEIILVCSYLLVPLNNELYFIVPLFLNLLLTTPFTLSHFLILLPAFISCIFTVKFDKNALLEYRLIKHLEYQSYILYYLVLMDADGFWWFPMMAFFVVMTVNTFGEYVNSRNKKYLLYMTLLQYLYMSVIGYFYNLYTTILLGIATDFLLWRSHYHQVVVICTYLLARNVINNPLLPLT